MEKKTDSDSLALKTKTEPTEEDDSAESLKRRLGYAENFSIEFKGTSLAVNYHVLRSLCPAFEGLQQRLPSAPSLQLDAKVPDHLTLAGVHAFVCYIRHELHSEAYVKCNSADVFDAAAYFRCTSFLTNFETRRLPEYLASDGDAATATATLVSVAATQSRETTLYHKLVLAVARCCIRGYVNATNFVFSNPFPPTHRFAGVRVDVAVIAARLGSLGSRDLDKLTADDVGAILFPHPGLVWDASRTTRFIKSQLYLM